MSYETSFRRLGGSLYTNLVTPRPEVKRTQEERNTSAAHFLAALPPRPSCSVCGTSDRNRNVIPCHWCHIHVCIGCYRDHEHRKK